MFERCGRQHEPPIYTPLWWVGPKKVGQKDCPFDCLTNHSYVACKFSALLTDNIPQQTDTLFSWKQGSV